MFRGRTGETPAAFVERLRLERAALRLAADDVPITCLAFEVGFRSAETFARRFRSRFGTSARDYRRHQLALWRVLGLEPGVDPCGSAEAIEVRWVPPITAAVERSLGADPTFSFDPQLGSRRRFSSAPGDRIAVTYDWPGITPPELLRQDRGFVLARGARAGAGLHELRLAGGLHATLSWPGRGPVPNEVYQRLHVRSLGGRYRLQPGRLVEIERRGHVIVCQPVRDTAEEVRCSSSRSRSTSPCARSTAPSTTPRTCRAG